MNSEKKYGMCCGPTISLLCIYEKKHTPIQKETYVIFVHIAQYISIICR